jgi:AhpD family alkylhydroperoxidase
MHIQLEPRGSMEDLERQVPGAIAALRQLTQAVDATGLDKAFTELLKVRASQINGCAFCLQFHRNLAQQKGVSVARLDALGQWSQAGDLYTPREQAALAWTDALTRMPDSAGSADSSGCGGISGAAYIHLQSLFSVAEIAALTTAIATINAWNRIAGALAFAPPAPI